MVRPTLAPAWDAVTAPDPGTGRTDVDPSPPAVDHRKRDVALAQHFEFRVPATTANLGPGYGVVGLALDLWFDFSVTVTGSGTVVERPDAPADKTLDRRHDPVVRGLRGAAERFAIDVPDDLTIVVRGTAPRRCGLGSNTAEFAGGIQAACRFAQAPPSIDRRLDLLVALGGDPGHGAAALRGGLAFAVPIQVPGEAAPRHRCLGGTVAPVWWCAITAPDVPLATADVHRVVPATVPNAIVQRSAGRLLGLLEALGTGDADLLGACLVDEVHVPYRMRLAAGMVEAAGAARVAGAVGVTISGHGPALLAFATDAAAARRAADAMRDAFAAAGVGARSLVVRPAPAPSGAA